MDSGGSKCFTKVKNNLSNTISIIENYDQFLFHPEDIKIRF